MEDKTPQNSQIPDGAPLLLGTCIHFNNSQKYGFLKVEGSDKNVFVHSSQIPGRKALDPGQEVRFQLHCDPDGRLKAVNVRLDAACEGDLHPRQGLIERYVAKQGFGFIKESGSSESYFFRVKSVAGEEVPAECQPVTFNVKKRPPFEKSASWKKSEAFNVIFADKVFLEGRFRFIDEARRYGIVETNREGNRMERYVFDLADVKKDASGTMPFISVGQTCQFIGIKDQHQKSRAKSILPKQKIMNDSDYIGFEPYLPEHFEMADRMRKNRSKFFSSGTREPKPPQEKPEKQKPKKSINEPEKTKPKKSINEPEKAKAAHKSAEPAKKRPKNKAAAKAARNMDSDQKSVSKKTNIKSAPEKGAVAVISEKAAKIADPPKAAVSPSQNRARSPSRKSAKPKRPIAKKSVGQKQSPKGEEAEEGWLMRVYYWAKNLCKSLNIRY